MLFLAAGMFLVCGTAAGQPADPEPDEGSGSPVAYELPVESDMELFNVPLEGSRDLFSRLSEFNFMAVRYVRRGYGRDASARYLNGLEVADPIAGRINYVLWGALRYLPAVRIHTSGMGIAPGIAGSLSGVEGFSVRPSESPQGGRVSLFASDRAAGRGLRAMYADGAKAWSYSLAFSRRWGRDADVEGLFMDETVAAAAVERRLGRAGSLTLFLLAASSVRSTRAPATREAFELTGDNLYNPSWGWYDGRQRSARVRREFLPTGILTYRGALGGGNTLHASAGYSAGEQAYGGLRWFENQSPLPDYYRYLPSRIDHPALAEEVTGLWRSRDPRVTQIDWDELLRQNATAPDGAANLVGEDVSRPGDLQLAAGIENRSQPRLALDYGVRVRLSRTDNFGRAANLLGGGPFEDVDQYLIDDIYYGDRVRNDLRAPGRRVREGDVFGYRYLLRRTFAGAYATLCYGERRLRLAAALEGGNVALGREGRFEKELFPGGESFGRSAVVRCFDYTAKLSAGYALSPRQFADAVLLFAETAPPAADVFLAPRYCNRTTDKPHPYATFGAEASYRLTLPRVRLKLTGYYTRTSDEERILHHYDDLSATYGNLVVSGLAMEYYGAELGFEATFSPRVSLLAAATLGSAAYDADPRLTLYADADASVVYRNHTSFMKDYRAGGSPQTAATAELRYSGTHGWLVSMTVSYMADAYISPDPTRRTDRAMASVPSPDDLPKTLAQERFDPACTVGLFVCKSFYMGSRRLTALVSASNLLDRRDIVYGGYEQMRMRSSGSGEGRTYMPFDSKYTYSFPRKWYASVIYKF